jgi:hypothetical protein
MAKDILTDAQVELEIDRLMNSKAVKLAKKEAQIKYKRRQYMYQLRTFEKRGKELTKQGYTLDNIEERMLGDIKEEQ